MKILPGAAVAASILCAHPASASPALDPESLAPAYAVDQFNDQRGGQAVWLRSGTNSASVQALLMVLRRAPLDGFASGPELADVAQAALGRAAGGDPVAVRSADKLLSSAWVMYVQALHWPSAGMIYADPATASASRFCPPPPASNPPFGRRPSSTISGSQGRPARICRDPESPGPDRGSPEGSRPILDRDWRQPRRARRSRWD